MVYTIQELSQLLGVNSETVRRWIRQNKLQAQFTSRKAGYLVTKESLEEFLAKEPKYRSKLAHTILPADKPTSAEQPAIAEERDSSSLSLDFGSNATALRLNEFLPEEKAALQKELAAIAQLGWDIPQPDQSAMLAQWDKARPKPKKDNPVTKIREKLDQLNQLLQEEASHRQYAKQVLPKIRVSNIGAVLEQLHLDSAQQNIDVININDIDHDIDQIDTLHAEEGEKQKTQTDQKAQTDPTDPTGSNPNQT